MSKKPWRELCWLSKYHTHEGTPSFFSVTDYLPHQPTLSLHDTFLPRLPYTSTLMLSNNSRDSIFRKHLARGGNYSELFVSPFIMIHFVSWCSGLRHSRWSKDILVVGIGGKPHGRGKWKRIGPPFQRIQMLEKSRVNSLAQGQTIVWYQRGHFNSDVKIPSVGTPAMLPSQCTRSFCV